MQHLESGSIRSVMNWSTWGQGTLGRSSHAACWIRKDWAGHDMEHVGSGKIGQVMIWSMLDQERLGRS